MGKLAVEVTSGVHGVRRWGYLTQQKKIKNRSSLSISLNRYQVARSIDAGDLVPLHTHFKENGLPKTIEPQPRDPKGYRWIV